MYLQENLLFDNRYRLRKLLGCGGFSEVWLVEDIKVGNKKMALKVYAPDKGLDDDGVQIFSNEFELVFDLNHTHLLRPSHFDVCNRSPYLLMPYCEYGSAAKLVGQTSEEEAWRILHDMAAGLSYLHQQEPPIIHQDIKPDNLLRDPLGNYQITDFGISAKVRSTLRRSMKTVASSGTMAYMPPERFSKDNMPIKASDVWAIGTTIFELLTGELPFGEHGGLIQKSGAEIPNIPGQWSDELREIIARCLQKEPWDRPVAQQIVAWTEQRLKNEKIAFESKNQNEVIAIEETVPVNISKEEKTPDTLPKRLNMKKMGLITGCLIGVLLFFLIIQRFTARDYSPPFVEPKIENQLTIDIDLNEQQPDIELIESEQTTIEIIEPEVVATLDSISTAPDLPPAWIADYDRMVRSAKSSYDKRDFQTAKAGYEKALSIAVKNADRKRQTAVKELIGICEMEIITLTAQAEVQKTKQEAEEKERKKQERLASYDFVGKLMLGASYMVVQRKSDYRWGIIDSEGYEVEPAIYSQVSGRLKNGYYALKNEKGWVVFDTSLKKVATGLERLTGY